MKAKKIEKKMGQFAGKAKELRTKAQDLQKKTFVLTLQNEIRLREGLHKIFNGALLLVGQGFMSARKANEAFIAATHRKVDSLSKATATQHGSKQTNAHKAPLPKLAKEKHAHSDLANQVLQKRALKKNKLKDRTQQTNYGTTAQAH